jgi:sterol desaturase/sphingolipid hydroxylase (fatty acid hydroxylase superfamily)
MDKNMRQRILSYLIVLAVFSINFSLCYWAIKNSIDYGSVTFGTILLFIVLFALLELLMPYKKDWHPTWAEWKRDGLYFVFVVLAGAIGQGMVYSLAFHLATPLGRMPLWSEIAAGLLIATLGGYAFHRLGHSTPFFWRIHGIHHVPNKVNLANNSVVHSFDVIGSTICSQLPLLILGFSEESMFLIGMFTGVQGYFIHANLNLRLGWLNYLIASPESHRLHHSVVYEEAGHYGTDLVLWDFVFRSFTWQDQKAPKIVGVEDSLAFPLSESVLENAIHPFRPAYRRTLTK